MAKRKRSATIEENGVLVRIFQRGDFYWLDARVKRKRGQAGGESPRKRLSADTTDRTVAEANARALAREIARQSLFGLTPKALTLSQLFDAYDTHKGRILEGQWKGAAVMRRRLFLDAWGGDVPVASISQSTVDAYSDARRATFRKAQEQRHRELQGREIEGAKVEKRAPATLPPVAFRPLRDGTLDGDFRWLSSVFNWAVKHKLPNGERLLAYNPLGDCKWPRERNVRRPIASHERYTLTSAQAGKVDPMGRLRAILALARYTGRRENAIAQLRADDVLLSRDRILAALAAEGMDERRADSMPHGALRWRGESDKQRVTHIAPISAEARAELKLYLSANQRVGNVPLFPAPRAADDCVSRYLAAKWLLRAERLAGLPKLVGGTFHPYRRLWATERKDRSLKTVAAAGGWKSTKSLALYQGVDDADILDAVVNA